MSWVKAIPIIGELFKDTTDIIKETITDKDKQNAILGNLKQIEFTLEKDIFLAALQTKTVAWLDGLHKMSRPILNLVTIIAVVVLSLSGKTITPELALILGGPNLAYQLIKGKGK